MSWHKPLNVLTHSLLVFFVSGLSNQGSKELLQWDPLHVLEKPPWCPFNGYSFAEQTSDMRLLDYNTTTHPGQVSDCGDVIAMSLILNVTVSVLLSLKVDLIGVIYDDTVGKSLILF